jgi:hypothetical protein
MDLIKPFQDHPYVVGALAVLVLVACGLGVFVAGLYISPRLVNPSLTSIPIDQSTAVSTVETPMTPSPTAVDRAISEVTRPIETPTGIAIATPIPPAETATPTDTPTSTPTPTPIGTVIATTIPLAERASPTPIEIPEPPICIPNGHIAYFFVPVVGGPIIGYVDPAVDPWLPVIGQTIGFWQVTTETWVEKVYCYGVNTEEVFWVDPTPTYQDVYPYPNPPPYQ